MPSYTLLPASDAGPNTGNGASPHAGLVDDNDSASGYIEMELNEEEWFVLDVSVVPSTDVVTGARVRVGGEDPDVSGDTLLVKTRLNGVETAGESVSFDTPGYMSTALTLTPPPSRTNLAATHIGARCTAQTGAILRLGYLVMEIDTTSTFANGPIIAGDEDATVM